MSTTRLALLTLLLCFVVAVIYSVPASEREGTLTALAAVLGAIGALVSIGGRNGGGRDHNS